MTENGRNLTLINLTMRRVRRIIRHHSKLLGWILIMIEVSIFWYLL